MRNLLLVLAVSCCAAGHAAERAPASPVLLLAANDEASAVDLEFWRSAERLATPGAYRAYLAAFPNGAFAPLARIALAKAESSERTAAPKAGPAEPTKPAAIKPGAALRHFTRPADSGAVSFAIGERFTGPAAVTVGWLGARKQLVLPSGEWVVLAASDSKSTQAPISAAFPKANEVNLTTVAFGRFVGERLITLLRFTISSKVASVLTWSDIDGCDQAGTAPLRNARSQQDLRDQCVSLRAVADPLAPSSAAIDEARESITRLGASTSGMGLVTTFTLSEKRRGYFGLARVDWPSAALGAENEKIRDWRADALDASATRAAYVESLWNWASAYRTLAVEGFRNESTAPEAGPGSPSGGAAVPAAAMDFDPTKPAR